MREPDELIDDQDKPPAVPASDVQPASGFAYPNGVEDYFDDFAAEEDVWLRKTKGYHFLVRRIYRSLIPEGARVLEVGCGRGDLLASLEPFVGVGVDISRQMIAEATARHPELTFIQTSGERLRLGQRFDYVVISDVVPYVDDLQAFFSSVAQHCHPRTRVIINTYSNLWRPLLRLMAVASLRPERPIRNWVGPSDLKNLVELAGLEVISERREIILPVSVPVVSTLLNGIVARLPLLRSLALSYWLISRPAPTEASELGVSVIIPCRNEAGSIEALIARVPEMGRATEIVFVEGHSTDDTRRRIEAAIEAHPERDISLLVQTGKGKANAVREGFDAAKHEVLMILDGDMTVAPEDLPKFFDGIRSRRGELIVGSRLVYGMEPGAMRFLNMIGNQLFARLVTFVMGQPITDSLCGTKVLLKEDYERVRSRHHEFGREDPYGDYELLLGAALLGLKVQNLPVRYGARSYGDTNIHRFREGAMLLRLVVGGFRRLWIDPTTR